MFFYFWILAMRCNIFLWFSLLVLITSLPIQAVEMTLQKKGAFKLSPYISFWQDKQNNATLIDASAVDDWQKLNKDKVSLGFSDYEHWFKSVINNNAEQLNWYLKITYPPLDYIDLYICDSDKITRPKQQCVVYQSGDQRLFSQRERQNPNFVLPLTLQPGKNYLYIHMKTAGSYQLPAEILDQQTLDNYLSVSDFIRGGYLTVMAVMIIYNLFIFMMIRSLTYFLYSATVFTFLVFFMSYGGSGFQYLWPESPQFNQQILPIAMLFNQLITLLFITHFLNINPRNKISYYYFRVLLLTIVTALCLAPFTSYKTIAPIMSLLSIIVSSSAFIIGLIYWYMGRSEARLFTIAWGTLVIGMIASNLRIFGVLPSNFFTLHGYQLGSFLEMILLSLSLGERIQKLQQEKNSAEQASIHQLKKYEDIYHHSLSGQFQLDNNKKLIRSNPSLQRILGYNNEQSLSTNIHLFTDLFIHLEDKEKLFNMLENGQQVKAFELSLKHRYGHEITTVITMSQDKLSNRQGWHGSLIDISDKKQRALLQEKIQKERMDSLHHLVIGISHEINTPLGNIVVAQSFLQDTNKEIQQSIADKNLTQKHLHDVINQQYSALKVIENSSENLTELSNMVKNSYVYPEAYSKQNFMLKGALLQWQKTITASVKVFINCPDKVILNNSELALVSIVQQLFDNSCQHNPQLFQANLLTASIEVITTDKFITIIYQDNGTGLALEDSVDIFFPFYTTSRGSQKRLGLGLYLVHNIVTTIFHGTITVDNNEKDKLIFTIQIPV